MRVLHVILLAVLYTAIALIFVGCFSPEEKTPLQQIDEPYDTVYCEIEADFYVLEDDSKNPLFCWVTIFSIGGDSIYQVPALRDGDIKMVYMPDNIAVIRCRDKPGDDCTVEGFDTIIKPKPYGSPGYKDPYVIGNYLELLQ